MNIAILDLSDSNNLDLDECAEHFSQATKRCGFVYVRIGDAFDQVISELRVVQRSFFNQSGENKKRIAIDSNNRGYMASGMARMSGARHHDQKEVFFWGPELADDDPDLLAGVPLCGKNQWPEFQPDLKKAVLDYSREVQKTGNELLQIIARSLNAPENFFELFYQRPMLRGQLLRYPTTQSPSDHFGVAPHSDFGVITLLLQETEGLEVLFPDGQWVPAAPIERTLVVNVGDLLERWSNKRLPSTKHRVRNLSTHDRYSIAMFYDPSPTARVDPHDLLPDEQSDFPPITAAEYILSRNRASFDHYKT